MLDSVIDKIKQLVIDLLQREYDVQLNPAHFIISDTRKEFKGDKTIAIFPLAKACNKPAEEIADRIAAEISSNVSAVSHTEFVKGFLNIGFSSSFWLAGLKALVEPKAAVKSKSDLVMVEYCSPNTNKPLHLGHLRNIFLGWSVAQILEASGKRVVKTQIVNDRGIHICKSMLAYQKFGNGETPAGSATKGDHLVGKYYVEFDKALKRQQSEWPEKDEASLPIMLEVKEMLRKWEAGDAETMALWNKMNAWVYEGFNSTYKNLGVTFDEIYYESETYQLGKEQVLSGLEKWCYKKPDGSTAVDLAQDGLDEKILLRADGTSLYVTQDIGTAMQRFTKHPELSSLIYTVGDEQNYHFKVLFKVLGKMQLPFADNCYHLSYGMVDLPEGKMKSREGTVVDADDLIAELTQVAKEKTDELGKAEEMTAEEREQLHHMIAMAALKYFILKVEPRKRMIFNPKESVDLNGDTGPFIQYTHARIKSLERKAGEVASVLGNDYLPNEDETAVIKHLVKFGDILREAAQHHNPSVIAAYAYQLAKLYNKFYHDNSVLNGTAHEKNFRIILSKQCALYICKALKLLGIEAPQKM